MITARLSTYVDTLGAYGPEGETWISMRTGYSQQFVAEFKQAFGSRERKWQYSQKVWLVKQNLKTTLESWLRANHHTVIWESPPPAAATAPAASAASLDFGVLQIAPHACFEVAQAAYRALCMKYHPDRGGLESDMVRLNTAWERVKKGYGK